MPDIALTKVSNPSGLHASASNGWAKFNPDGDIVAFASAGTGATPFLYAIPWDNSTGFGSKYADPASVPGAGLSCAFTPAGDAILIAQTASPFIAGYPFSKVGGFGAKYSNPASLPPNSATRIAIAPSGAAVVVPNAVTSPYISGYPFNSTTGFGPKYSNPGSALPNTANGAAFNPAGSVVGVASTGTPYIHAYAWTDGSGFGSKYSNPSSLPPGNCNAIAFSPGGGAVIVTSITTPFVVAYRWDNTTGFGSQYSNPASPPPGNAFDVSFTPDGSYVIVTSSSATPFFAIYNWSDATGFGDRVTTPADLPNSGRGAAISAAFSMVIGAIASSPLIGYTGIQLPANTVAPSCAPSSGTVADTFTFSPGTWTGSPTSYETSVSVDGGAYTVIDTSAGGNPSKTGTQLGGPGTIATRVRASNGVWSDYVAGTTLTVSAGGRVATARIRMGLGLGM